MRSKLYCGSFCVCILCIVWIVFNIFYRFGFSTFHFLILSVNTTTNYELIDHLLHRPTICCQNHTKHFNFPVNKVDWNILTFGNFPREKKSNWRKNKRTSTFRLVVDVFDIEWIRDVLCNWRLKTNKNQIDKQCLNMLMSWLSTSHHSRNGI